MRTFVYAGIGLIYLFLFGCLFGLVKYTIYPKLNEAGHTAIPLLVKDIIGMEHDGRWKP